MDSKNERVKIVREETGLSQKAFAEKMGLTRDVISNIEYGRTDVKEYVAKAICREYKVNYAWLNEGIGIPRTAIPDEIFSDLKVEYDLIDEDIEILKDYSNMEQRQRAQLRKYISALIEAEKKG